MNGSQNGNKRIRIYSVSGFVLFLATLFCLSIAPLASAQSGQKNVEGKVFASTSQPLPGAIVYLKNGKTGDIKSFISTASGSYRFGQLSADVDYDLWAEHQGRKSSTKTISSFDSKKAVSYDLKIDTGK